MSQEKNLTFADALKRFTAATRNSMKYAEMCAMMAIRHFEATGDLVYCQSFMDAMPKNFVRKQAFLQWLVTFSPAELKGGKLVKDKSETANPFNVEAAEAIKFWDFLPETEVVNFSADDLIAAVLKVVDRFENGKKYSAADEKASATIENIRKAVKNIQPAGNIPAEAAAA